LLKISTIFNEETEKLICSMVKKQQAIAAFDNNTWHKAMILHPLMIF